MTLYDVTSMSSKGQIVIPTNIRSLLGMEPGNRLIIFTDGENVLLKPIQFPQIESFKDLIKESRAFIKKQNIKKSDVEKIIKNIRDQSCD